MGVVFCVGVVVETASADVVGIGVVEIVVVVLAILLEAAVVACTVGLRRAAAVDKLLAAIFTLEVLFHDEAAVVGASLHAVGAAGAQRDGAIIL